MGATPVWEMMALELDGHWRDTMAGATPQAVTSEGRSRRQSDLVSVGILSMCQNLDAEARLQTTRLASPPKESHTLPPFPSPLLHSIAAL